ncbi:MAG: bifunctional ADP-dependent NAD(P)H-hydrate dehydratase/NAD(P)H-hydrate epimerase, partial [Enterobacterales bacterium]|nr:bifunctional ADP-dependent NAD(P)H-hydrate dehydratase/NAD(P)H-hydrate epimerase [Enterobacterales bacterium]
MSEKPDVVSQPLYSADDVKLIERTAVAIAGYDLFELMQRAGQSAYKVLRERWP